MFLLEDGHQAAEKVLCTSFCISPQQLTHYKQSSQQHSHQAVEVVICFQPQSWEVTPSRKLDLR